MKRNLRFAAWSFVSPCLFFASLAYASNPVARFEIYTGDVVCDEHCTIDPGKGEKETVEIELKYSPNEQNPEEGGSWGGEKKIEKAIPGGYTAHYDFFAFSKGKKLNGKSNFYLSVNSAVFEDGAPKSTPGVCAVSANVSSGLRRSGDFNSNLHLDLLAECQIASKPHQVYIEIDGE